MTTAEQQAPSAQERAAEYHRMTEEMLTHLERAKTAMHEAAEIAKAIAADLREANKPVAFDTALIGELDGLVGDLQGKDSLQLDEYDVLLQDAYKIVALARLAAERPWEGALGDDDV